ncbi:MAG: bacteriohopanetetrol glucosamine biosynthesis glycosyltransferase HpnI [Bryobacteraceae bacterium]|nr:bacteriohopanetetrol glucosamine biosynthesis glycosyltransferase HpnI [Bryobacteraceae bacterium]
MILLVVISLICLAAAAYQMTALRACLRQLTLTDPWAVHRPRVSILKPVRGADEGFYEAIRTHAQIDYPDFEILFGVREKDDAARDCVERLQGEYPAVNIGIVDCYTDAPNAKVGSLIDLERAASSEYLVINDSDISVPRDYLYRLVTALDQPGVGLITCLYRATGRTLASRFEALGISTDFAPSALVAPFVGVKEFGLGSTLALKAVTLKRVGGFAAVGDYIADDYHLGKRISDAGLTVEMSRMVVSTGLNGSWSDVWEHQVRWSRTIRVSRSGYFGIPVTNATLWAIVAGLAGYWFLAVPLLLLRLVMGVVAGRMVLRDGLTKTLWWCMPLRDLLGFAVWIAGSFGDTVRWKDQRLHLGRKGRILHRD